MSSGYPRGLRELLQKLYTDFSAFSLGVGSAFKPIHDPFGDDRTVELLLHPARRAR